MSLATYLMSDTGFFGLPSLPGRPFVIDTCRKINYTGKIYKISTGLFFRDQVAKSQIGYLADG